MEYSITPVELARPITYHSFLHFILSSILYSYIKCEILYPNIQKVLLEIPMFIHGNSNETGKDNIVFMDMKQQK